MRPNSIVTFERLVLLYLAIGVLYAYLVWDQTMASLQAQGAALGSGTIITIQAITVALYLLLVWFISRKGSPVAKWIYVVLGGLSLVLGLIGIQQTISWDAAADPRHRTIFADPGHDLAAFPAGLKGLVQ